MPQDFKPIFDYLDDIKTELKADIISAVDLKTDKIQTTLDGLVKDVNKFDQERLAQNNRIDTLEKWAKPAGEKLKIPLAL